MLSSQEQIFKAKVALSMIGKNIGAKSISNENGSLTLKATDAKLYN